MIPVSILRWSFSEVHDLFLVDMTTDVAIVAVSGAVFICACLALAIKFPHPTAFQLFVFRTVLSLSGASAAAAIPGFLSVTTNIPGIAIRAGGALAVFLILYRFNPATLIAAEDVNREIRGLSNDLRTLDSGLAEILKFVKASDDSARRKQFADYLDHIANAIDQLVQAAKRTEGHEEQAFEQACGMIGEYLSDFGYDWVRVLPERRVEEIREALRFARSAPANLRFDCSPAEVRTNTTALSQLSGRFRAMAQAARTR